MAGLFGGGAQDAGNAMAESAGKAAGLYNESAQKAIDFAKEQAEKGTGYLQDYYGKGQEYLNPYMQGGQSALKDYLATLGIGDQAGIVDKFRNMPGYQFALDEGLKATERRAAAGGRTHSGGLLKELTQYGQGLADQHFNQYQDRLGALASLGANASSQASGNALNTGGSLAQLLQNLSGQVGNSYTGMGENAANAELAAGNARANAYQNSQNSFNSLLGNVATAGGYILGGPAGGIAANAAKKALIK